MARVDVKQSIREVINLENSSHERICSLETLVGIIQNGNKSLPQYETLLTTMDRLLVDENIEIQNLSLKALGLLGALKPRKFIDWIFHRISVSQDINYQNKFFVVLVPFLQAASDRIPFQPTRDGSHIRNANTIEHMELDVALSTLMPKLHEYMEIMPHHYFLQSITEFLSYMTVHHKTKLQPYFVDFVDILIGWILDVQVPRVLRLSLIQSFDDYKHLWEANTAFSMGLLNKLVQDIEDLSTQQERAENERMTYLVSCFVAVAIHSPHLVTTIYQSHNNRKKDSLISRVVESLQQASCHSIFEAHDQLGDAFILLSSILETNFAPYYLRFAHFYFSALSMETFVYKDILSILNRNFTILSIILGKGSSHFSKLKEGKLWLDEILLVLDIKNIQGVKLFHRLLLLDNEAILNKVKETYLLLLKSHPTEAFELINKDLMDLSHALGSKTKDNTSSFHFFSKKHLESLVMFHILVLGGCFFVSSYSIVSSLVNCLNLVSNYIDKNIIQIFILKKMRVRCISLTEENVETLGLLFSAASSVVQSSTGQLRLFGCNFLCDLLTLELGDKDLLFLKEHSHSSTITVLLEMTLHLDCQVRISGLRCLELFVSTHNVDAYQLNIITTQALTLACDRSAEVSKFALCLLGAIGIRVNESFDITSPIATTGGSIEPSSTIQNTLFLAKLPSFWRRQLRTIQQSTKSNLSVDNFASFMQSLFSNLSCITEDGIENILDLFLFCTHQSTNQQQEQMISNVVQERQTNPKDGKLLMKLLRNNNQLILCWAMWESAKFCVDARLRTNLGGATQIFPFIEKMLIRHVNHMETVENSNRLSLRMLLEYVAALERCIYNAYEGSYIGPNPSISCRNFFKTNRNVCDDWLIRIRSLLLTASVKCNSSPFIIRYASLKAVDIQRKMSRMASSSSMMHSSSLQRDIQRLIIDLDHVLMELCSALCDRKESDPIRGYMSWSCSLLTQVNSRISIFGNLEKKTVRIPWMHGVLLESQGRYEDSIEEYLNVLSTLFIEASKEDHQVNKRILSLCISPKSLEQVVRRCCNCYLSLGDWSSLDDFVAKIQELRETCQLEMTAADADTTTTTTTGEDVRWILNAFNLQIPVSLIRSLSEFSVETPPSPDLKVNSLLDRVITDGYIQQSERIVLEMLNPVGKSEISDIAYDVLREPLSLSCLDAKNLSFFQHFFCQLQCLQAIENRSPQQALPRILKGKCNNKMKLDPTFHHVGVWNKLLEVYEYLARGQKEERLTTASIEFRRGIWTLARKQGNFLLSKRLLGRISEINEKHNDLSLESVSCYENARLLHAKGSVTEAILELWQLVKQVVKWNCSEGGGSCSVMNEDSNEIALKSLLRLSQWTQSDRYSIDVDRLHDLDLSTAIALEGMNSLDGRMSELDRFSGQCLDIATQLSPTSAKAWLQFSNWCYRQSNKTIEGMSTMVDMNAMILHEIKILVDRTEEIPQDQKESTLEELLSVFHMFMDGVTFSEISFEQHLMSLFSWLTEEEASSLSQLHRQTSSKFLHFHRLAAHGYFTFLMLSNPLEQHEHSNILATLRLLRLLAKYGNDLKDIFDKGLSITPIAPWQEIIPQLLARLGHPNVYVAQTVHDLISRLVDISPHLVVYPAIVGAKDWERKNLPSGAAVSMGGAKDGELDKHLMNGDGSDVNGGGRLLSISQTLGLKHPLLVNEVSCFVDELQRISILWDEVWLSHLSSLCNDLQKRVRALRREASRVEQNGTLSSLEKLKIAKEKYGAMMKPLILSVEKIWRKTGGGSRGPETPYEMRFIHLYGASIRRALTACRFPTDPTDPATAWAPFHEIRRRLADASNQRSLFLLKELSPRLSTMSSRLPTLQMPGVNVDGVDKNQMDVLLHSFGEKVTVLRTKTKPKKMEFIGSDGKAYSYLLKGSEDLHLDERIMQLLSVVQGLLDRDPQSSCRYLRVKHYNVIPLSDTAGLIQLVPNVITLFQVYKERQNRSHTNPNPNHTYNKKTYSTHNNTHNSTHNSTHNNTHNNTNNMNFQTTNTNMMTSLNDPNKNNTVASNTHQPSSMFYGKLVPLLKAQGVEVAASRSDWPLSVLLRVYRELNNESPKWLLEKELWLSSDGPSEWWFKTGMYSRSLAVMSIVGYIIGLGDRHLDNILIDFDSGEILHIDYNICFDKGQRLKVPEVVPFRLTSMMQCALGTTGTEGRFRIALEHTLRVLRRNRETLLTLLEAFVYDPLVDWTADAKDDEERRRIEMNVSLSLFVSRLEEKKVEFKQIVDDLISHCLHLPVVLEQVVQEDTVLFLKWKEFSDQKMDFYLLHEELKNLQSRIFAFQQSQIELDTNQVVVVEKELDVCRLEMSQFISECQGIRDQYIACVEDFIADNGFSTRDDLLGVLEETVDVYNETSLMQGMRYLVDKQQLARSTQKKAHSEPFLNEAEVDRVVDQCCVFDAAFQRFVQETHQSFTSVVNFSTLYHEKFSIYFRDRSRIANWGVHQEWIGIVQDVLSNPSISATQELIQGVLERLQTYQDKSLYQEKVVDQMGQLIQRCIHQLVIVQKDDDDVLENSTRQQQQQQEQQIPINELLLSSSSLASSSLSSSLSWSLFVIQGLVADVDEIVSDTTFQSFSLLEMDQRQPKPFCLSTSAQDKLSTIILGTILILDMIKSGAKGYSMPSDQCTKLDPCTTSDCSNANASPFFSFVGVKDLRLNAIVELFQEIRNTIQIIVYEICPLLLNWGRKDKMCLTSFVDKFMSFVDELAKAESAEKSLVYLDDWKTFLTRKEVENENLFGFEKEHLFEFVEHLQKIEELVFKVGLLRDCEKEKGMMMHMKRDDDKDKDKDKEEKIGKTSSHLKKFWFLYSILKNFVTEHVDNVTTLEMLDQCNQTVQVYFNDLIVHQLAPSIHSYLEHLLQQYKPMIEKKDVYMEQSLSEKMQDDKERFYAIVREVKNYHDREEKILCRKRMINCLQKDLDWMVGKQSVLKWTDDGYLQAAALIKEGRDLSTNSSLCQNFYNEMQGCLKSVKDLITSLSSLELSGRRVCQDISTLTSGMQAASKQLAEDILADHKRKSQHLEQYFTQVKFMAASCIHFLENLMEFHQSGVDRRGLTVSVNSIDQKGIAFLSRYMSNLCLQSTTSIEKETIKNSLKLEEEQRKVCEVKILNLKSTIEKSERELSVQYCLLSERYLKNDQILKKFLRFIEQIAPSHLIQVKSTCRVDGNERETSENNNNNNNSNKSIGDGSSLPSNGGILQQVESLVLTLKKVTRAMESSSSDRQVGKSDARIRRLHLAAKHYLSEHLVCIGVLRNLFRCFHSSERKLKSFQELNHLLNERILKTLSSLQIEHKNSDLVKNMSFLKIEHKNSEIVRNSVVIDRTFQVYNETQFKEIEPQLKQLVSSSRNLYQYSIHLARDASAVVNSDDKVMDVADDEEDAEAEVENETEMRRTSPSGKISRNATPVSGKEGVVMRGQERNTYAVKVLRKVKDKLEGHIGVRSNSSRRRDPEGHMSVSEQVDWLIQQATCAENLCQMYEGWTPWI